MTAPILLFYCYIAVIIQAWNGKRSNNYAKFTFDKYTKMCTKFAYKAFDKKSISNVNKKKSNELGSNFWDTLYMCDYTHTHICDV